MIVYDEADELFCQHTNNDCFEVVKKHLKNINKTPQQCLYSATYNDDVITKANHFVGNITAF